MSPTVYQIADQVVLAYPADGAALRDADDVLDLIGDALGNRADIVVIPARLLGDDFFQLRTGMAGTIAQKFVNYRLRLAVLGDISGQVARSTALRDFVHETNRGNQLWFLPDHDALEARLTRTR